MKAPTEVPVGLPSSTLSPRVAQTSESRLLRVVGVWGLAAGIVNITIGGGIFRLPAGVYKQLGDASPIAYLVCAVVMALVVTCFAEAGSRVPSTGGLYAYVEVAFGPLIGFASGVLIWAGMTAAVSAVAVFFGDAVTAMIPSLAPAPMRAVVIAVVLAALGALNILGVAHAARFNNVMTVAKIVPLLIVVLAGIVAFHPDRLAIAHLPAAATLSRGSVFLIFAFLGVESALVPSGEVRDPARTVPRAIALALGAIVVLYVCIQIATQSALGSSLADAKTPVADAAGLLLGAGGRTLILVGTAVSMFGYVSGMTLAVPRMLYAFGRDGFLVRPFASVHPKYRTPHVAIIVQTMINIALATTGSFERLALAANGSILLVYAACALAVLRLRRHRVETTSKPFIAPFGGVIPVLAFAAVGWLLWSLTAAEWLALGILTTLSLIIYGATASNRSRRAAP